MKMLAVILTFCGLILGVASAAHAVPWAGAASVRDETFYVPSSGLNLGAWTTIKTGNAYELSGYEITDPFQINLEYQAGIRDEDIANINTYFYPANAAFPSSHADGAWAVNFDDCEEYLLDIDPNGGLTVYTYPAGAVGSGDNEVIDPDIEWTITAWHQTILAGDIVDNGNGTITLRVLPAGTYRPFDNDPPVNAVEVFDGDLDTEVLGYTFTGVVGDIGDGSTLTADLVPEPATMGLLGLGALALLKRRRS